MAIYPFEGDPRWKDIVEAFIKLNNRSPNDLDKCTLVAVYMSGVDQSPVN